MATELRVKYPAVVSTPGVARRDVTDYLDDFGLHDLVPVAVVLVSELVTNALLHAQGPIDLHAIWSGSTLHVDVSDRGRGVPVSRAPDFGRGLQIVAAMASTSGDHFDSTGHTAWFELERR